MAEKRASEVGVDEQTSLLKHDIERTRNEIEDTVSALETRLSPARIKEQISSVKQHAVAEFHDAKERVKGELKHDVEEVKHKVKDEIDGAKYAMREATVGKVEHMVHRARNEVRDVGVSVADRVRANPIPLALIGVGAAWLLMSSRSSGARRFDRYASAYRYDDEYGDRPNVGFGGYESQPYEGRGFQGEGGYRREGFEAEGRGVGARIGGVASDVRRRVDHVAHDARDKASHLAHDVADKASHVAHDVRDRAMHAADDVRFRAQHAMEGARERAVHFAGEGRMRARQVGQRAEHLWDENPLAIGAVAFAVGAAVGLALPTSQAENRIFGPAKERLMNKAGEAAREAMHMAEDKAKSALHMAEEKAKNAIHGDREGGQGQGQDRQDQQDWRSSETRPNGVV